MTHTPIPTAPRRPAAGPPLAATAAGALFAALAAASAWLWLGSWTTPPGWRANPLALAREAHARLAGSSGSTPEALDAAERLIRAELAFGPVRPAAWLRLAALERTRSGRVEAATLDALRNSYRVAPHDPESYLWRTRFVLEHWSVMPADLRGQALAEVSRFYSVYYRHHAAIERLAYELRDPAGRLALRLAVQRLDAQRRAAGLPVYPLYPLRLRPAEDSAAAAPQPASSDQSTAKAGTWSE